MYVSVRVGARKTYKIHVIFELNRWHVCFFKFSEIPYILLYVRLGTCRLSEQEFKNHDQTVCLSVSVSVCVSVRAVWMKTYK